ncbi:MAG: lysozyme inhibitor LprI family protein [Arcobacteraceae bacterium]
MKKIIVLTIVLIVNVLANDVKFYKPSFDCSKVKEGSIEYKICTDLDASKLDSQMNNIWHTFDPFPEEIRKSQRSWLKERNACKTIECIRKSYEKRITVLGKILGAQEKYIQKHKIPARTDRYIMVENYDDKVCHQVNELLNNGMMKNGEVQVETYKELNWVQWEKVEKMYRRDGKTNRLWFYGKLKMMPFDMNNDGNEELVFHEKNQLSSNMIFDAMAYYPANIEENVRQGVRFIDIAPLKINEIDVYYNLYINEYREVNFSDNNTVTRQVLLEFFDMYPMKLNNTYYLFLYGRSAKGYPIPYPKGFDQREFLRNEYVVIQKYDEENKLNKICVLKEDYGTK